MNSLLGTLARTVVLDDDAYREWRKRPHLFLRGILLILVVTLIAGLITLGVNLVDRTKPVDAAEIEKTFRESMRIQRQWNPSWQSIDPEARQMMDEMMDEMTELMVPMVIDLASTKTPLPRGFVGLFQSVGSWVSRALSALGGWLFYGALVLIAVNLLGGSAKLPDFLGMVALYSIPGLLALFTPIPCLGAFLALIGAVWSIVVYVKAVSVVSGLDGAKSLVAVVAPFFVLAFLAILLSMAAVVWLVIIL
jgi:hypothetical protein